MYIFVLKAHERSLRAAAISQCERAELEVQEVRAQLKERLAALQASLPDAAPPAPGGDCARGLYPDTSAEATV